MQCSSSSFRSRILDKLTLPLLLLLAGQVLAEPSPCEDEKTEKSLDTVHQGLRALSSGYTYNTSQERRKV